jgi:alpha-L-fucosidase 2
MLRLGLLWLSLASSPAVLAASTTSATVRDVVYGEVAGETLLLDAVVPSGAGPFPILILIHGGGWTGGDKAGDIAPLLSPLAAAGFTCVSINYRLAPQHRWPACRDDVLAAIRWVKAHAAKFKGDGSRIALIGYSAGGHLASFAATVVDDSARVQAVVGLAALTDFEQELPKRGHVLGRAQQGLLNRPAELTPESLGLLRALSPVNHLRPGLPPFFLLHGDADQSVPFEQSVAFQSKLRALGVRCDLLRLPGAPHRLSDWDKFLPDYRDRLLAWLHEVLRPLP